jgi:lipid II:glycine glycyltransferase (peptidoglycan interpeptide bridge formation enzyme)
MAIVSAAEWDKFLKSQLEAHILQTSQWGKLKSAFNWQPEYVISGETGAMVLFRRLPLGFSLAYIPKGPLGKNWQELWPEIDQLCHKKHAFLLMVEPDLWVEDFQAQTLQFPEFVPGSASIQPCRTIVVNLQGGEEEWLARMKQKTRYNIHLAQRKGVTVRVTDDLSVFHQLMHVTGERDSFGVHSQDYYQRAYDLFHPNGSCEILLAEYEGQPLAALMVFKSGKRAWYFYGASNDLERNRMPAYLLQWEAMRWAAQQGCEEYDLWGVPDQDEEELEAHFAERSDGLWGVYRFKRGFGGQVRRAAPLMEKSYNHMLTRLYRWRTTSRGGNLQQ